MQARLNHLFLGRRRSVISISLSLIAALFVFSNAIGLSIVFERQLIFAHFVGPVIWLAVHGFALYLLLRFRPSFDPIILAILMLFSGWGILLADRLAPNFLSRQIMWVVLGTAVVLAVVILPRNLLWLRKYRYTLLFLGVALLVATFFFGVNPSGATNANYWLRLPFQLPVFFQPSELLKLLLVIFLASYFDEQAFRQEQNIASLLAPILLMGGFCLLLLVWQRDLGAATLFFILFLSLFYVATGKKRYLLAGFSLLLVAGVLAYFWFDVVALRVDAWRNPWPDADGRAFQIVQSLYALASGGVFGQGIGQGFPDYIPVVHSDFVFAAIGEEWGLVGSLTIVFCYVLLMHKGMMIGLRAKRPFHRYLAAGLTILLSAQAILIMGGVTKLLPLTGVTLPFISYGGSSMIISHLMAGLLLYLSCQPQDNSRATFTLSSPQKHLQQLHFALLIIFIFVALSLVFWPLFRASTILVRDDNPRQVEAALRVQRGQILDRNGEILAQTVGTGNELTRRYPIPTIGPAIGYYSFKHGTAGVEAGFNEILNGESDFFEQSILHRPTEGQKIQVTIDAEQQIIANALMEGHTGGLILLKMDNESSGYAEIISMVSSPNYDPNQLDEIFDSLIDNEAAPLLNRTTLGQYQPGMILQPFVLATAVSQDEIALNQPVESPNTPSIINETTLQCHNIQDDFSTWQGTLRGRCPHPMLQLGDRLGSGGLSQSFASFGFTIPITLPLDVEETAVSLVEAPDLAAIGQDTLTITPLALSRAWIALMTNGQLPLLRIVSHVEAEGGEMEPVVPAVNQDERAVPASVASAIQATLPQSSGQVREFSATAVSGPANSQNSWYLGQKTINDASYFVVIILENGELLEDAEEIGRELLLQVETLE